MYYHPALEYPDVKEYFSFPIDASQDMLVVVELLLCEIYQLLCASQIFFLPDNNIFLKVCAY